MKYLKNIHQFTNLVFFFTVYLTNYLLNKVSLLLIVVQFLVFSKELVYLDPWYKNANDIRPIFSNLAASNHKWVYGFIWAEYSVMNKICHLSLNIIVILYENLFGESAYIDMVKASYFI